MLLAGCCGEGKRKSIAWRHVQATLHSRARNKFSQHPSDIGKVVNADQISGTVEFNQVADPRKGGDVGNRVFLAHYPVLVCQMPVEYAQQAPGFVDVTVARALVFEVLASKFGEEAHLAEHGSDTAHLKHQPLDSL